MESRTVLLTRAWRFCFPFVAQALAIYLLLAFGAFSASAQQDMPVPVKLHVAMLCKTFGYNKSLKGSPKVLVVYNDASASVKDEAMKSFMALGFPASAVKQDQLSKHSGDENIVYVAAGNIPVQKLCEERGLLSISGIPALAENGKVAMSIGTESGRPRIFIHLGQTKAQKQELSAEVLKLAKVFGGG